MNTIRNRCIDIVVSRLFSDNVPPCVSEYVLELAGQVIDEIIGGEAFDDDFEGIYGVDDNGFLMWRDTKKMMKKNVKRLKHESAKKYIRTMVVEAIASDDVIATLKAEERAEHERHMALLDSFGEYKW